MSLKNVGKIVSFETRKKMSKAMSRVNHPNFGKTFTPEIRAKISKALSGDKHPFYGLKEEKSHNFERTIKEETKLKLSAILGTSIFVPPKGVECLQIFPSAVAAAKFFNISHPTIRSYAKHS